MRFFAAPLLIFVTAALALAAPIVESTQHDSLNPAHIGVRVYRRADGEGEQPSVFQRLANRVKYPKLFGSSNTRPIESTNRIANRPIQDPQSVSANAYQIGRAPSPDVLAAGTSAQANRQGRGRSPFIRVVAAGDSVHDSRRTRNHLPGVLVEGRTSRANGRPRPDSPNSVSNVRGSSEREERGRSRVRILNPADERSRSLASPLEGTT